MKTAQITVDLGGETIVHDVQLETEEEGQWSDGKPIATRWIAEIAALPGVMVYGETEAIALENVTALAKQVHLDARAANALPARIEQAERIVALATTLPPGTVTRAALPVLLESARTSIPLATKARDRRVIGLGYVAPSEISHALLMRDVVLKVFVGARIAWSTPITFLPGDGVELRRVAPPITIAANESASFEIEACTPLPPDGVGIALVAEIHTPENENQ